MHPSYNATGLLIEVRRLRAGLESLKFPPEAGQFDSVDCVEFNKEIDSILKGDQ